MVSRDRLLRGTPPVSIMPVSILPLRFSAETYGQRFFISTISHQPARRLGDQKRSNEDNPRKGALQPQRDLHKSSQLLAHPRGEKTSHPHPPGIAIGEVPIRPVRNPRGGNRLSTVPPSVAIGAATGGGHRHSPPINQKLL